MGGQARRRKASGYLRCSARQVRRQCDRLRADGAAELAHGKDLALRARLDALGAHVDAEPVGQQAALETMLAGGDAGGALLAGG